MAHPTHRTGDIGEAAFLLKCTQLGLAVARPFSGKLSFDYITWNGRHCFLVQVKATGTRASRGSYHVTTARGSNKSAAYKKGDFDFLVIYVDPEATFYILPRRALGKRVAISVPSRTRKSLGPFAQHHERWDLLTGKKYKPTPATIPTLQAAADPNCSYNADPSSTDLCGTDTHVRVVNESPCGTDTHVRVVQNEAPARVEAGAPACREELD